MRTDERRGRALVVRILRTALRTLHLLAVGAYFGGHVFSVPPERLMPAVVAVVATGLLFVVFETWSEPVWLVQMRGVATYVKLALTASVPLLWDQRIWILSLVMTIGVVITHAPANLRYYSVKHRRVVYTDGNG
jgi:uncharacterized membrane protein